MSDLPWLTIIGLGENGPEGLTDASRKALSEAEIIMGPPRHLSLLPETGAARVEWPVPFADGVQHLLTLRGRRVVVLASGDPFWFGAGTVLARYFAPTEWSAHPGPSVFSLAAAKLGWGIEGVTCLGLHAAPLSRLRPHLAHGVRLIVTLRDGAAVGDLAAYLVATGFGSTQMDVLSALGGPRERHVTLRADEPVPEGIAHPVCVALTCGEGPALPRTSGKPDEIFETDGQLTKRPVRALTLSALAPRPYERLWDIGGGTGTIAIEWLLSDRTVTATTIEQSPERAARIARNATDLGVERLQVVTGTAPAALDGLPDPDVVFVGGGLSDTLLEVLQTRLRAGTRLVCNAVTLESEATLTRWHGKLGGDLMRIELAHARALGSLTGWKSAYPVVQWSVTL